MAVFCDQEGEQQLDDDVDDDDDASFQLTDGSGDQFNGAMAISGVLESRRVKNNPREVATK